MVDTFNECVCLDRSAIKQASGKRQKANVGGLIRGVGVLAYIRPVSGAGGLSALPFWHSSSPYVR
jgi:hypothetical protein